MIRSFALAVALGGLVAPSLPAWVAAAEDDPCRAESASRAALAQMSPLDLRPEDHGRLAELLGPLLERCPETLPEVVDLAVALEVPGFWDRHYPRLERAIDSRRLADRLPMLPAWWALQFGVLPIERHAELRHEIGQLASRLEAIDRRDDDAWWRATADAHEIGGRLDEAERLRAAWRAARPDAARPDAARPDAARPDAARPDETITEARADQETAAESDGAADGARPWVDTRFLHYRDVKVRFDDRSFSSVDGRRWTLDDFTGKVTLVNLWATWCKPCIAEMPLIQQLHDALADDERFQVVSINVDNRKRPARNYLEGDGASWTFPVLWGHPVYRDSIQRLPQTWLVDADGMVRRKSFGFVNAEPDVWLAGTRAELERLLD